MTSDIAVDSCVAVKWVLKEVDTDTADRLLSDLQAGGRRPLVLDLALVEVGNALWKQFLQGWLPANEVLGQFKALTTIPFDIVPAAPLIPEALLVATKYRRSVYDALFVVMSHKRGCIGVTADEPLYHAVTADFPQIKLLRNWP